MKLYSNATAIFLIWVSTLLIIAYLGFVNFPHSEKFSDDFFKSLANWDGGHYLGIAQYGYSEKFQYAFFPLYPILIKFLSLLTQDYTLAALLISLVATFLSINIFFQLVSLDFGKKLAQDAVLWLLFFPTSFYLLTVYAEGLFFVLVVATFLFFRKNNLFLATIIAALASATRIEGLAVSLALILGVAQAYGINRKNWYVFLSPAGFIFYSWYLFQNTGDPFYFIVAEKHWQRSLVVPGLGVWKTIRVIVKEGVVATNFPALLDLLFAIFGLGMILRSLRFLHPAYFIYGLVSIVIPLMTSSLSSMPRFLLPIFPIFIVMALWQSQYVKLFFQLIFLLLLSAFTILFINGYWVS